MNAEKPSRNNVGNITAWSGAPLHTRLLRSTEQKKRLECKKTKSGVQRATSRFSEYGTRTKPVSQRLLTPLVVPERRVPGRSHVVGVALEGRPVPVHIRNDARDLQLTRKASVRTCLKEGQDASQRGLR